MTRTAGNPFLTLFEERAATLEGAGPAWLARSRREAIERFRELGFPTRKDEAWRYTNLTPITGRAYRAAGTRAGAVTGEAIGRFLLDLDGPVVVFVDGHLRGDLSRLDGMPSGLTVAGLADSLSAAGAAGLETRFGHWSSLEHELYRGPSAFMELNSALFEDGLCVTVAAGAVVETPLQVLFYSTSGDDAASACHVRNLIVAGRGSQARIVEIHAGVDDAGRLNNIGTDFVVEEGAHLEHHKLQVEAADTCHIATQRVAQARDSHFTTSFFSFGGALVRHEIEVRILDEGCQCDLNGMYVVDGERHVDNTTTIHHAMPHCHSREVYKGILADRAQGSFTGKIYVHPDAQKTDAKQSNDSLLLSPDATINARPNLEIYADDVRCTHGATIGQLDSDALFYMRSRGISERQARNMLTRAFAHEVIDGVSIDALRERLDVLLIEALPGEEGAA